MAEAATASTDDIPAHPEEIKTTYNLRLGKSISLQGSARITPAGIVTIGVTTLLVALAFRALATPRKPTRRHF